jgi:hypothetical protein
MALYEERSARQVAYRALWATHESNAALNLDQQVVWDSNATLVEDLRVAQASAAIDNQELIFKAAALDEVDV